MNYEDALKAAGDALEAINPQPMLDQIAVAEAKIEKIEDAQHEAQLRVVELGREISHREAAGPDRHKAATALLAGEDVLSASRSVQILQAEKAALVAARQGLTDQHIDAKDDLKARRRDLEIEIRTALSPAITALRQVVLDALAALDDYRASALSLYGASGSQEAASLANHLAAALQAARAAGLQFTSEPAPDPALIEQLKRGAPVIQAARRTV